MGDEENGGEKEREIGKERKKDKSEKNEREISLWLLILFHSFIHSPLPSSNLVWFLLIINKV